MAPQRIESPCVQVCRVNAHTRLCEGCGRSLDEIAAWSRLDASERRTIMDRLAARAWHAAREEDMADGRGENPAQ